jgi:hypothetical protein
VFPICRRGLDSSKLIPDPKNSEVLVYKPELIVLQVGIVDCAPRVFREIETKILSIIPPLFKLVLWFVKKYRKEIVAKRRITNVNKDEFENNLKSLKQAFPNSQFVVVPIAPSVSEYENKSPGISHNIALYNEILKRVFGKTCVLTCYDEISPESILQSDLHHINKQGHELIFNSLINEYNRLMT